MHDTTIQVYAGTIRGLPCKKIMHLELYVYISLFHRLRNDSRQLLDNHAKIRIFLGESKFRIAVRAA